MIDQDQNRAAQAALYGAPLADIAQQIRDGLGLTQGRLAELLSLSAPMLSQLLSAQRVKIGNPAVVHRLESLFHLAAQAAHLSPAAVEQRLTEIQSEQATITGVSTSSAERRRSALAFVKEVTSAGELERLAAATTNPELAAFLREAAGRA